MFNIHALATPHFRPGAWEATALIPTLEMNRLRHRALAALTQISRGKGAGLELHFESKVRSGT